jgi:TonB family protein
MKALPILVAIAFTPAAAIADDIGPVIQNPVWIRKPDGMDMARFYPGGGSGEAVVKCRVDEAGKLKPCEVVSETSSRFGAAAIKVAGRFQMKRVMADGQSVKGGQVVVPIRWVINSR